MAPQKKEVNHLPVPIDFHDTMLLSFRDGFVSPSWMGFLWEPIYFVEVKWESSQVNFCCSVLFWKSSQFFLDSDSVGSETEARERRKHIPPKTESQKILDSKSAGWERGIHMLVPRQVRFVELTCNHFIHLHVSSQAGFFVGNVEGVWALC